MSHWLRVRHYVAADVATLEVEPCWIDELDLPVECLRCLAVLLEAVYGCVYDIALPCCAAKMHSWVLDA